MICMVALALSTSACDKRKAEPVGFGIFKIGKSTPADGYKCQPEGDYTFCFLNPSPLIAGHKTQTDLYFRGHAKDAPLIEIQVGVWACDPGPVGADLMAKMGEPSERSAKRSLWRLKHMTVVAQLPKDNELCMVHFLDPGETKRVSELYAPPAPQ